MKTQELEQQEKCKEWEKRFPAGRCTLYGKEYCTNICNYAIKQNSSEERQYIKNKR